MHEPAQIFASIFSAWRRILVAVLLVLGMFPANPALAQEAEFQQFLASFEQKALAAGISSSVYRQAIADVHFDPAIGGRISGQPEFTTPIWEYLDQRVNSGRISRGRAAFDANKALFLRVGQQYGVDPYILAAIWGIETDYGAVLNNSGLIKPIVPSLANLVFAERGRVAQDEAEFISALALLQRSGLSSSQLVGSWAGAIGHLQVNPGVILRFGTDGDGDGKVDLHRSLADALATSAQLLRSFGYLPGTDWGFEVEVPSGVDLLLATREEMRPVSFFAERGVKRVAGRQFSDPDEPVFLYLPAGLNGPKFLMTKNYLVLKDYNFSDSYALSVAHLTDRLKGAGQFVQPWPRQTQFPNRSQRVAIQQWLKDLGFYSGEVDGRIGPISQRAYQFFQSRIGVPADGFITLESYNLLQRAVGQ
ncbi:MAG: lytic murein transglycosylase [Hyphomicrobiaceae bacterium]|nr:lytic murein transglycosylase [Hyphomicrobiaceae bacterium]MCC0024091.1 lytic murein transglycosylase [Hyphomicrobiaceae bacterium]